MKIQLYTISKPLSQTKLEEHYHKLCRSFGVEVIASFIFPSAVAKAQKQSPKCAQESYTKALLPLLLPSKQANIALHPQGASLDSQGFAKLFANQTRLVFFIGGAFGFEQAFLDRTTPISLSPLTFSHTIVGVIVLEQIYRACSLLANHPYHK